MTVEQLIKALQRFPNHWFVRGDVFSSITSVSKIQGKAVKLNTSDVI